MCSDSSTASQESAGGVPDSYDTNRGSTSTVDSVVDESELGEFLMDTFEGLDGLEIEGFPLSI
eukprot:scaffold5682_cov140-Cylindrotheca_fusiformis.AAC.10